MIRLALFLSIINLFAYGQDTLAILEPERSVLYPEVSFAGDSMLVRLVFDSNKDSQPSNATWYNSSGKIADVDASALGQLPIMDITKYQDHLFYYAGKRNGKKDEVAIYSSAGLNSIKALGPIGVTGDIIRGLRYRENFLVVTWDQKNQLVRFYKFDRDKVINEQQLQLDKELMRFESSAIAFLQAGEPARISVMKTTLRFFLNGETFAAVYDMPGSIYPQDVARYKTKVVRLNLSTGVKSDQSIYSYKTFAFKSFLLGNHLLYRLAISKDSCKINIHDLDDNKKIIHSYHVPAPREENVALYRKGSDHEIKRSAMHDMRGLRTRPNFDVGIVVDEYNGQQVVSLGVISNSKGGFAGPGGIGPPFLGIISAITVTATRQMTTDPNDITYMHLKGTTETGYEIVPRREQTSLFQGRLDQSELDAQANGRVDDMTVFVNSNYCIEVTKYRKSPKIIFTKLPRRP